MRATRLSPDQARRFLLHVQGLIRPFDSLQNALDHLGYVQIDSINVCGRMHDLILRNRLPAYRENELHRFLHGPGRPGFEHYLPDRRILVALPAESWRFLLPGMMALRSDARAYGGRLNPEEEAFARDIVAELRAVGPLKSDSISGAAGATTAWGSRARQAKVVLEKLHMQGRVAIAARDKFRRIYDLPERVIRPEVLALPSASTDEVERWLGELRLRQWRLTILTKRQQAILEDRIHPIRIDDVPPLFMLRSDLSVLENALATASHRDVRLLAPLDPLIYNRKLTRHIWDFDYTWEVYTPAAKRKRGYYALPVLSKEALVGHVEVRAERRSGRLSLLGRRVARGHSTAAAIRELEAFLELQ